MGILVLIPWPETTWSAAGRFAGRTSVPLTEAGRHQAGIWGERLTVPPLAVVYSGNEEASTETARIVAAASRARCKTIADLAEVDAGLWDGLTVDELKKRHPKAFKRWQEDPAAVRPPEGESLPEAFERLTASMTKLVRKQGDRGGAVVLGPLALAVIRCAVEEKDLADVRAMMSEEPVFYTLADSKLSLEKPVTVDAAPAVGDRNVELRDETVPRTEGDANAG